MTKPTGLRATPTTGLTALYTFLLPTLAVGARCHRTPLRWPLLSRAWRQRLILLITKVLETILIDSRRTSLMRRPPECLAAASLNLRPHHHFFYEQAVRIGRV